MKSETMALQQVHKLAADTLSGRPLWIQGDRSKSWTFCCSECGEISYYPQNHSRLQEGKAIMGYRYCPYCRAEMAGVAILRMSAVDPRRPERIAAAELMDELDLRKFSERLRETLAAKKLTQREVAERAGIAEARMSRLVWGDRRPLYAQLYNLAVVLGVDIGWLSGRDDTGPD